MNIAYTIWIEGLGSPILKSQVIEILKTLKKISPDDRYFFFAFQPIYTIILHSEKLRVINEDLRENNIRLIIIPSLVSPILHWFSAKWYLLPLIFLQTFPILNNDCCKKYRHSTLPFVSYNDCSHSNKEGEKKLENRL